MKLALLRVKMAIGALNPGNVASFPDEPREDPKRSEIIHPSIAESHVEHKAAVRLSCAEALGLNTDGPGRKPVIHLTPRNCLKHGFTEDEITAATAKLPKATLSKLNEIVAGELRKSAGSLLPGLSGPSMQEQTLLVQNMSAEERRNTADLLKDEKKRLENLQKQLEAA